MIFIECDVILFVPDMMNKCFIYDPENLRGEEYVSQSVFYIDKQMFVFYLKHNLNC